MTFGTVQVTEDPRADHVLRVAAQEQVKLSSEHPSRQLLNSMSLIRQSSYESALTRECGSSEINPKSSTKAVTECGRSLTP